MSESDQPKTRISVTSLPAKEQELDKQELQQIQGGAGYIEQDHPLAGQDPNAAGVVWGTKPSPEQPGEPSPAQVK